MKVRVKLSIEGNNIDEVIDAPSAEALLVIARDRVAKSLGWKGMIVKAMAPVTFAQEAVKLYNKEYGKSEPLPQSATDFVEFGKRTGNLTVIDE